MNLEVITKGRQANVYQLDDDGDENVYAQDL